MVAPKPLSMSKSDCTGARGVPEPCLTSEPPSTKPAKHSERRRATNRTASVFSALGARDQAFALSLFAGRLARSSDCLRFLAGLALGRFFIGLATPHLAKNALALHLLF